MTVRELLEAHEFDIDLLLDQPVGAKLNSGGVMTKIEDGFLSLTILASIAPKPKGQP